MTKDRDNEKRERQVRGSENKKGETVTVKKDRDGEERETETQVEYK